MTSTYWFEADTCLSTYMEYYLNHVYKTSNPLHYSYLDPTQYKQIYISNPFLTILKSRSLDCHPLDTIHGLTALLDPRRYARNKMLEWYESMDHTSL